MVFCMTFIKKTNDPDLGKSFLKMDLHLQPAPAIFNKFGPVLKNSFQTQCNNTNVRYWIHTL